MIQPYELTTLTEVGNYDAVDEVSHLIDKYKMSGVGCTNELDTSLLYSVDGHTRCDRHYFTFSMHRQEAHELEEKLYALSNKKSGLIRFLLVLKVDRVE